jgi:hypothetical protein
LFCDENSRENGRFIPRKKVLGGVKNHAEKSRVYIEKKWFAW